MQNGIIFSSSCGTRNNEVSATMIADAEAMPRCLADHLDVIDQHQQHEDAGEHPDRRDHEAAGEIAPKRVGHHAHAATGRRNSRSRRALDLLMASSSSAGGSMTQPAMMIHTPRADRREQHQILHQRRDRRLHRHHRAGEAGHAQSEHREDGAADRKIAALARGARRAEKGEGEGGKCERIDRRHEAVMQLGAELAGHLLVDRIVLVRVHQFPEIAFANAECDVVALVEFRHVEGVTAERHQRRIALADLEAFEIAVLENQERAAVVLQHRAVVGDDADALLGIAAIVDEDAGEQAARLAFPDPDGQILCRAVRSGRAAGCWSARRR